MVMVAPGSDAFIAIVHKMKSGYGIAAIPSGKGFALNLIETRGDARYLQTKKSVMAKSVDEVADKVKCLVGTENLGAVPIILFEEKKCTLVDADLTPRTTDEGVIERSFARV